MGRNVRSIGRARSFARLPASSDGSEDGARGELRSLAAPRHIDEYRVASGYRFACLTVRRNPW